VTPSDRGTTTTWPLGSQRRAPLLTAAIRGWRRDSLRAAAEEALQEAEMMRLPTDESSGRASAISSCRASNSRAGDGGGSVEIALTSRDSWPRRDATLPGRRIRGMGHLKKTNY